jgi:hypothetical protein
VSSISCASAGNCSAGGYYRSFVGHRSVFEPFVVDEEGGVWVTAVEVPGAAALNAGGDAGVRSVSCASAGNCSAGGFYVDSSNHRQALLVDEDAGVWHTAAEIPSTTALNEGRNARVDTVSCGGSSCGAGGDFNDDSGVEAFVANKN